MKKETGDRARRILRQASIVCASVLFVVFLLELAFASVLIHPGLSVGGVSIGGKGVNGARAQIVEAYAESVDETLTLTVDGTVTATVTARLLGLNVDATETVRRVMRYPENTRFLQRVSKRIALYIGARDIEPVYTVDDAMTRSFLANVRLTVDKPARSASVEIQGGRLRVIPAQVGREVDSEGAREALVRSLIDRRSSVSLKRQTVFPRVTTEEAERAMREVELWVSQGAALEAEGTLTQLAKEELLAMVTFVPGTTLRPAIDATALQKYLKKAFPGLEKEPKNAQFVVRNDVVSITPSTEGRMFDAVASAQNIEDGLREQQNTPVIIAFRSSEPERTTEKAQAMGVVDKLATFTTSYKPTQTDRVANIHLLSELIDGNLVAPGDVWSFNNRLGPRSSERGFRLAPTIVNGELVPTPGGGACQVATTLFNTVFFSGLEVTARHNHSFYIGSYPDGRDATVSYGGYDVAFRNDLSSWVLLKAAYTKSSVTITFFGTKDGRTVEHTSSGFRNFRAAPVSYLDDPALPDGQEIVVDEGISGRDITVKRIVRRNGTVIHEDSFFSRYKPKKEVRRRGTMVVPPPTLSPDPSTTTSP